MIAGTKTDFLTGRRSIGEIVRVRVIFRTNKKLVSRTEILYNKRCEVQTSLIGGEIHGRKKEILKTTRQEKDSFQKKEITSI